MADPKPQYELTFIVSGVLNDDRTKKAIGRVTDLIEDNGGEVVEVDEKGSQRLAYEIDNKRSGYYVHCYFRGPGEIIPRLERAMTIDDDFLRYLTLRKDAKMLRHYRRSGQSTPAEEA